MLGHLDPDFHEILLGVVELLQRTWGTSERSLALALSATGTSAMEAGIVNLVAPGEIVAECGSFGRRITEIARRHGVEVVVVPADWGQAVENDRLLAALDEHPSARMVAVVHAETSTGVEHPLEQLGTALGNRDVLLMADWVTSLGGIELDFDRFRIDYGYSCTQKCRGAPPGMAPVALSERALRRP
jgi:alanine-glyoxylate transaminase/serine-glyoxylate transaminase/serine-pyruvate transaminase